MVVYEIVGGLAFIGLVALGLMWLTQNIKVKSRWRK